MTWGLHGVDVVVDGAPALVDVDLAAGPGRIVAVVGGDGAGKTTVARVLVGLASPVTGTVITPPTVGYQPAGSGVWPDLTVDENLGFVADAHRLTRDERRRRIDDLLDVTTLGGARSRLGAQLSGGMRQKLGMAMALLSRPDLVVLDESTTGVDPVSRTELWRLMTATAAGGVGIVFTTTYLDEAQRAHDIVALDEGRVLAHGSFDEIAGSMEGVIAISDGTSAASWRRGSRWHTWYAEPPPAAVPIEPDLTDLLVAATLRRVGQ